MAACATGVFEFCNIAKYVETFITPIKLSDALAQLNQTVLRLIELANIFCLTRLPVKYNGQIGTINYGLFERKRDILFFVFMTKFLILNFSAPDVVSRVISITNELINSNNSDPSGDSKGIV